MWFPGKQDRGILWGWSPKQNPQSQVKAKRNITGTLCPLPNCNWFGNRSPSCDQALQGQGDGSMDSNNCRYVHRSERSHWRGWWWGTLKTYSHYSSSPLTKPSCFPFAWLHGLHKITQRKLWPGTTDRSDTHQKRIHRHHPETCYTEMHPSALKPHRLLSSKL